MGLDWLYNPIAIPRDIFVKPIGNLVSGGDDSKASKGGISPQPLPEPPKPDAAATSAEQSARRRKAAATQTVFTDPLGVGGQADVVRKTLTGQ